MSIFIKLVSQFFLDLFYFPIWWYGEGAKRTFFACLEMIQEGNRNMSPGLWLKNIFVPMFGQTDWQGRITSFFIRLINVIARGIGIGIWICIVGILFLLWIISPAFVVFEIASNLFLHF